MNIEERKILEEILTYVKRNDERLTVLEVRMDKLESRMDKLESRMNELENQFKQFKHEVIFEFKNFVSRVEEIEIKKTSEKIKRHEEKTVKGLDAFKQVLVS